MTHQGGSYWVSVTLLPVGSGQTESRYWLGRHSPSQEEKVGNGTFYFHVQYGFYAPTDSAGLHSAGPPLEIGSVEDWMVVCRCLTVPRYMYDDTPAITGTTLFSAIKPLFQSFDMARSCLGSSPSPSSPPPPSTSVCVCVHRSDAVYVWHDGRVLQFVWVLRTRQQWQQH